VKKRRKAASRDAATPARARLRVGVIYGGRSVEHECRLVSARAIMQALDPRRYEVVPIGIHATGTLVLGGSHYALPPNPRCGGSCA